MADVVRKAVFSVEYRLSSVCDKGDCNIIKQAFVLCFAVANVRFAVANVHSAVVNVRSPLRNIKRKPVVRKCQVYCLQTADKGYGNM